MPAPFITRFSTPGSGSAPGSAGVVGSRTSLLKSAACFVLTNGVIRDCAFVTRGGQSGGCVRLIAQGTGGLEHEHRAGPKLDSAGSVSTPDI